MRQVKIIKIYFCFAVLLLVAKPFLGFSMFNRVHPPAEENIFVKAFNKRKQEYAEDSSFDIIEIQKKLANPVIRLFFRFAFFLGIILPAAFKAGISITNRHLRNIQLSLSQPEHSWLLNSKLII
jgi:hypothetical protein